MKRPPRTLTDIRNEIFRIKGNIDALQNNSLFSDDDRAVLVPRYRDMLKKLEEEEKIFRTEVRDHETVKA